jgi:hypothetical protein
MERATSHSDGHRTECAIRSIIGVTSGVDRRNRAETKGVSMRDRTTLVGCAPPRKEQFAPQK